MSTLRLEQMSLVTAILREIERQSQEKGCGPAHVHAFQMNAVCEGATAIVKKFNREFVPATPGMGLSAWRRCDDRGLSSNALAYHLCGAFVSADDHDDLTAHPHDPSDFGRCHRFLEAVPEAKVNFERMIPVSPVWASLVMHWGELTALYLEELPSGRCGKLYDRMKQLGC